MLFALFLHLKYNNTFTNIKNGHMKNQLENYWKFILMGIIIIALAVPSTLKDTFGSLATVFIVVDRLFLILGMRKKRNQEEMK